MEYTFTPLRFTQLPETNTRRARCQRCRRDLAPRAGVAWVLSTDSSRQPTRYYYCRHCSQLEATEQQALEASAVALTIIGEALQFQAPLGFLDENLVVKAIRRAGSDAPRVVESVADSIRRGERLTVWDVVFHIDQAAQEDK